MTREEILNAAKQCVCHDRNDQYGEPEDNFAVIADFWNAYLGASTGEGWKLAAVDVANMMVLFKVARVATAEANPGADSFVDIAGYAACGGEIETKGAKE